MRHRVRLVFLVETFVSAALKLKMGFLKIGLNETKYSSAYLMIEGHLPQAERRLVETVTGLK